MFKYSCFISYTTREAEVVVIKSVIDRIIDRLRAEGFVVPDPLYDHLSPPFYDYASLPPQRRSALELKRELADAISASACVISFVSPGYVESPWCQFEWKVGYDIELRERFPLTFAVVWKPLSDDDWRMLRSLGFPRLPPCVRSNPLRPSSAVRHPRVFAFEAWERDWPDPAISCAVRFIRNRTSLRCDRPTPELQLRRGAWLLSRSSWMPGAFGDDR